MKPVLGATLLWLVVLGCGPDALPTDAADAGVDARDTGPYEPTVPAVPEAPLLPSFGACPAGWAEIAVGPATACEPWSLDFVRCDAGEARFPGDPACAPLGSPCPADGWPIDLPSAASVHHVREGAAGGDGSRGAPFGALAEAIAVSSAGDVIALAAGTYSEASALPVGVALVGACAAATILEGPVGEVADATVALADGTSVRDVTIVGARPGIHLFGGEARISDVLISATSFGIIAAGTARLFGERVVVRDTAPTGTLDAGLFVSGEAQVEISRGLFEGNAVIGAAVGERAALTLEDVAIRETQPAKDGSFGFGVVANGGSLALTRVVVEHVSSSGVFLQERAVATIDTLVVRDVESDTETGATGYGIGMLVEATLDAQRVYVARVTTAGILSTGFRVRYAVSDLFIDTVSSQVLDGHAGVGLIIDSVPDARLERALTMGTRGASVGGAGSGVSLAMTDLTAIDLEPEEADARGIAAAVDVRGGSYAIRRLYTEGARGAAVLVSEPGTVLTLEDARLIETRATGANAGGRGVSIQRGARFVCTRCEVGPSVEAGIIALGPGGESTLRDVRVESTVVGAENGAAMGLVVVGDAVIDMERFVVSHHGLAGLQFVDAARFSIRDGVISDNPVGVNAQRAVVDPAELSDRVIYRDNGINLDSTALPVPSGGF